MTACRAQVIPPIATCPSETDFLLSGGVDVLLSPKTGFLLCVGIGVILNAVVALAPKDLLSPTPHIPAPAHTQRTRISEPPRAL
jgi:hypothetical protein